jgi:MoxR-like ATPase
MEARTVPSREEDEGVTTVKEFARRVRENVQQVIVGKSEAIDLALIALLCGGHALIEDVPGTGKTTLARALSASLQFEFRRIQFTPDLVPADVLGVNLYNTAKGDFEFRQGPVFTQLLLADEINRATPRTQSALLEAMQEGQASIDGVTRPLPKPFLVMATLNPVEMEGTFPLPEAQLDRFLLRISLGYPNREEEATMLDRFRGASQPSALKAVAVAEDVAAARRAVDAVRVDSTVRDYLISLVEKTRSHNGLRLGASPRSSLALQHAAQARAAMDGREFVLPDDIKALAVPVLAHRLAPEPSAMLRGTGVEQLISEIVRGLPVPMERS